MMIKVIYTIVKQKCKIKNLVLLHNIIHVQINKKNYIFYIKKKFEITFSFLSPLWCKNREVVLVMKEE
jgi:hypothetical protein